ncbi:MAG: hypothetical protein C5B52_04830 [Bacteroidetes bacterium]|nr:MAG: hypothetical protein C5B52_04830 [Bacteroidota bacterium]
MKKILIASVALLLVIALSAHEFWLEPQKFICKRGEPILVRFMVGENFEGENWNGNRSLVNSLKIYSQDFTDDLTDALSDSTSGDSLKLQYFDEGELLLTYQSNNKFIQLEASKFNEYLKEEGLDSIIGQRKSRNETDSLGRESYQRSVKTLILVGNKTNDVSKMTTDLPVDIVPQSDPYSIKNKQDLKIKIFFNQNPLPNSLVKLWHRVHNSTEQTQYITNADGEISVPVSTTGKYMLTTVVMQRQPSDSASQWQSYWSSLTWGYEH